MEPHITGAATLSKVTISPLALMKIVQHGSKSMPELCAGCLVGLDDGAGGLEITDCFAYPSGSSGQGGDDEDGAQADGDAASFRDDMLKLLHDSFSSEFCVGWYRTVNMGDWCNMNMIEQQFEHQEDCDQGTGKAKSCVLVYDPYQSERGILSIKALRLTDTYMELLRARSSSDAKVVALSDAALSRFKMSDIFYEIPVEFGEPGTLARLAMTNLSVGGAKAQEPFDVKDIAMDRLCISVDPYLEKNVAFAIEDLDALQEEQQKGTQFQKALQRQKVLQDQWLAQRRQENALRAERGEDPLPLEDPTLSFFKVHRDNSKMNSLFIRKQIDVYCEQINDWSSQSLEKLFLLNSVQQQGPLPQGSSAS